ncbi:MAG: hypothetical protein E6I73_09885 [Chloroflexi bacterium]|nr:MAG: hypothetical protein E6I73_09885 [Chloroflexota bacterium]
MGAENEADQLIDEGYGMAYGADRIRAHSEAVRVADLHQDVEAGFRARQALIQSANMGGDPNLALVAFAWCLGQHDANPDRFSLEEGGHFTNLLWMYKWIVERTSEHPGISRSKLADLIDDMSQRYRDRGFSLRPVRKLQLWSSMNMLDREKVPGAVADWLRHGRDSLSDCMACDVDWEAAAHLAMRDLPLARQAAAPLFENRMRCAEVPTLTYGRFLLPLSQAGDNAEAERLAHQIPRRIGTNRDFVQAAGTLVVYLVEHNPREALRAAPRYSAWALTGETPLRRLLLMIGLVRASRLAREMGKGGDPLGILLPSEPVTSFDEGEPRLYREACNLADAFDKRNGHSRVGDAVRSHLEGTGTWWWPL